MVFVVINFEVKCDRYRSSSYWYMFVRCSHGGKPGSNVRCQTCSGRGIKVTLRQLGPGMVQQMQTVCPECRGEGELYQGFLEDFTPRACKKWPAGNPVYILCKRKE